jgi:four helix bundle protein
MSADVSLVQQAGVSAPAVSVSVVRQRPGAELAAALAASVVEDHAAGRGTGSHVLDAEKLTVYHVALELQCMANTLVPSVNRVLRDQFERASLSVILNLAEGCGRVSRRQRRYHFGVARGSATECAALIEVLRLRRLSPASECSRARSLAIRCVQMLTKLVESMGPAELKTEAS